MAPSHTDGNRRDATISELIGSLFADVALIARREAELATIELKEKASEVGVAAGILTGGVVFALFALATLVSAAVLALALVLPAWAAALVVAAGLLAVATVLGLIGRARLRAIGPLMPTRTLETAQEDIGWIRRQTDELNTAE